MPANMQNNTTSNSSHAETGWKNASQLIKEVHYLILALLIIAVNSCVITAVWQKRILRKWPNFLLVSLACSDLSLGLLGLPLLLLCTLSGSNSGCVLCFVAYTFAKFLSISTILHLLAITYERFLFIVYPFYHERLRGKHFKLVLIGVWLSSLSVALVPYTWSNMARCSETDNARQWILYTIITLVLFLIVPMILFVVAFCSMFLLARVHIRKQEALTMRLPENSDPNNAARREARVAVILLMMWTLFVMCWTPYFVVNIATELEVETDIPNIVFELANVLRFLTSLLNPVLYSLMKKDFCQALGWTCNWRRSRFRRFCLPKDSRCRTQELPLHSNVTQRLCHLETGDQGLITQLSTV